MSAKVNSWLALALWLIISIIGIAFTQWQKQYYTNELATAVLEELYVKEVHCLRRTSSIKLRRKSDYAEYWVSSIRREQCDTLKENDTLLLIYDEAMDEYVSPNTLGGQKKEAILAFLSLGLCILSCGYYLIKRRT